MFFNHHLLKITVIDFAIKYKLHFPVAHLQNVFQPCKNKSRAVASVYCNNVSAPVQGANVSCVSGWLRVWGNIQALSDHQKALIIQTSHMNPSPRQADACSSPTTGRYTSTGRNLQDISILSPSHDTV